MSAYPVDYDQSPPVERSRLSVFFRWPLLIPHYIWLCLYGIAAFVVLFVAWFVIIFTGRYPEGMYNFVAGFLRYSTRVNAYSYLIVDQYPPFDGGEHSEYPIRVEIGPRPPTSSRLKAFFRWLLAIPILILLYVFALWLQIVAIGIWFVAVIMGKTGPGLTEAQRFPISYYARGSGYMYMLTDEYPPVSDTETLPHLSQPAA